MRRPLTLALAALGLLACTAAPARLLMPPPPGIDPEDPWQQTTVAHALHSADSERLVRSLYAAVARGDAQPLLLALSPEVRWVEAAGGPYGGVYVGPQQVRDGVFGRLAADWQGLVATPRQVLVDGASVVVLGQYRGTAGASGLMLNTPFAHVWTVIGGRVMAFEQHTDTAAWWRALGR